MTAHELWVNQEQERREMAERHSAAMAEMRAKEYPVGTVVKFSSAGHANVEGEIVKHCEYEWQRDRVVIRNLRSKRRAEHVKYIWELEK